ncbi:MAG: ribonuclease HIII [Planctomycetes bacterium]|nr:ribonuclease HIII [Planctomycetota bacterium]
MNHASTHVLKLDQAAGQRLADALNRAGYEFRHVQHARFQARGEGVVATLYDSGKLVLQGRGLQSWAERFLGDERLPPAAGNGNGNDGNGNGKRSRLSDEEEQRLAELPEVAVGSDEAGKGDTFGALVVCAMAVPAGGAARLREAGVCDSKRLTDARVRILAAWLRKEYPHAERLAVPDEYNQLHRDHGSNVNRLLTEMHCEVLLRVQAQTGIGAFIVDRFGADSPVTRQLARSAPAVMVHEIPRAEVHPAVAGASILARDRFLEDLERLSEMMAVDLPRGSGAPVPPALRRFLEIHGPEQLGRVAKLHFKNVQAAVDRHLR